MKKLFIAAAAVLALSFAPAIQVAEAAACPELNRLTVMAYQISPSGWNSLTVSGRYSSQYNPPANQQWVVERNGVPAATLTGRLPNFQSFTYEVGNTITMYAVSSPQAPCSPNGSPRSTLPVAPGLTPLYTLYF